MKPLATIAAAVGLLFGAPVAANADVATSIQAELVASGVPNPSVSITTPPAATAADLAAFDADPSQSYTSITPYNLLSPDPSAPQPVTTVSFLPTAAPHIFPGAVPAPGEPGDFVEDAESPVWDLSIAEAVKHAIAGGATIAGVVTFGPPFPGRDTSAPETYAQAPDPADFSAPNGPQTMTTGAVQVQYQMGLPAQYAGATVSVADVAGGQRQVTIQFNQSVGGFTIDKLSDLTDYADGLQAQLNDPIQGANIGRVIVRSSDPTTGTPLFTHAADVMWGQEFEWSAPTVRSFVEDDGALGT